MKPEEIAYCCQPCGYKARERANMGALPAGVYTYTQAPCDACGQTASVTHVRNYGYPFTRLQESYAHWN
jgi:Fe-S-cluster containining protein